MVIFTKAQLEDRLTRLEELIRIANKKFLRGGRQTGSVSFPPFPGLIPAEIEKLLQERLLAKAASRGRSRRGGGNSVDKLLNS